jgi:hypothetical protein
VIFTISARPNARAGYNIAGIGVSTLADWPEKISKFRRNREKMLRHFLRLIHHQHLLRQVYIGMWVRFSGERIDSPLLTFSGASDLPKPTISF